MTCADDGLDPRVLCVFESFDGYGLRTLTTAVRLAMASAAVKALDMHAAKVSHPSSPYQGTAGWDGFDPGADIEPDDDHTVTDPHALWGTYHHETGGAA